MNPLDRRRASSSHVLRTYSRTPRHTHAYTANTSSSGAHKNLMPTVPSRAATINNVAVTAEDTQEIGSVPPSTGGAPLTDRDKHAVPSRFNPAKNNTKDKKQKEREKERSTMVLHEKDERIAYLEGMVANMEESFAKELDKLSQNDESEAATFWQAKHSALNQQFLRADTELRVLRSEVKMREAELSELRQGCEVLRGKVRERDKEIHMLKNQVRDMKKFVSTSTRTDGLTSDQVFGEGMARLGNGLQNWVITNFRRTKFVDFVNVDEATLAELSELVPMYKELAQGAKIHLLQSIVSRIVVEMVFGIYFLGLSDEQLQHFRQLEATLSQLVLSEESVNQWRATTLALLRRDAPQLLQDETGTHIMKVTSRIKWLLETITTDVSAAQSSAPSSRSDNRDSSLGTLVTSSVELSRLLVAQKAVFRVHMPKVLPHQPVIFDSDTMEDVGGEDEDTLIGRKIWCVVLPGIIKHGDENGGQMQYRNVVAKAKVLCCPEN